MATKLTSTCVYIESEIGLYIVRNDCNDSASLSLLHLLNARRQIGMLLQLLGTIFTDFIMH